LDPNSEGFLKNLSLNNKVILTWWHSGVGKNNSELLQSVGRMKKLLSYLSVIHVPCKQEFDLLKSQGIAESKIKLVPEGIEDFFRPCSKKEKQQIRKNLNIPEGSFCIGYFQKDGVGWGDGCLPKKEKGPDIFIETVKRLAQKHSNIFIVLTGPARGYVKEGLSKAGISFIHNYLSNYKDIINYYGVLDLYFVTSRTEGGPKSVLESMSCGIPIVSTKVGMSLDVIKDGYNGFLCDIENVDELFDKSEQLIQNEGLRQQFSVNGIETVKDFSWNNIAKAFIEQCMNIN
jgi:glycosyltransferase involved in cell wall biosynthesis